MPNLKNPKKKRYHHVDIDPRGNESYAEEDTRKPADNPKNERKPKI
jgi:hypothetical protein